MDMSGTESAADGGDGAAVPGAHSEPLLVGMQKLSLQTPPDDGGGGGAIPGAHSEPLLVGMQKLSLQTPPLENDAVSGNHVKRSDVGSHKSKTRSVRSGGVSSEIGKTAAGCSENDPPSRSKARATADSSSSRSSPSEVAPDSAAVTNDPAVASSDPSATADSADTDAGEGASTDANTGLFCWRLVGSAPQNGLKTPMLVVSEVELAKEMTNKRYRPQGAVKKLLESHFISVIKKAPSHHKNAKFVCRVCELHWDSLTAVQKHVADGRHTANRRRVEEMTAVTTLPAATPAQYRSLTALLSRLHAEQGLTQERLASRHRAASELRSLVMPALRAQFSGTEYSLELFGSARTGVGFSDSPVDLALTCPAESVAAAELTHLISVVEDSDLFTEVTHDFQSWTPTVQCVHVATGHRCLVAIGADRDVQLSALVEVYCSTDSRVALLATALRHLARVCEMERPQAGSLTPSAFVLMALYFLQQLPQPVLPVLHELAGDSEEDLHIDEARALAAGWTTENTSSLGTLWLQLLQFYTVLFTSTDTVVSLRQRAPVSRLDKAWGNKKISIEDPVQPKRNVGRTISSTVVADVIVDRLRAAALLFGVVRTAAGPAICLTAGAASGSDSGEQMVRVLDKIPEEELLYSFDIKLLCGETSMPVVCSVCQKTGHVADACPTLEVPPPEPLPPVSEPDEARLDQLCHAVFNDWAPPQEEYLVRQQMVEGIEVFIRRNGFPSARLQLFGSSCNGFGFRNSDLDICMTFDGCHNPESLDQAEIIRRLAQVLMRLRSLHSIIPITTAKVPIVKFVHRYSRLEGDISLYNTLAMHNTLLLHTYAKLDARARILGYMVKLMAKICDICDASRGSLSSYAFTLMMIYYLQHCQQPVLPVLQELATDQRECRIVDGCDVSFFSDLTQLRRYWPQHGHNTQSAGALWVGFLRFYCETFDFDRHVICVRRSRVLTKFEKLWNGAFIAVEDPFLLSHNLGAGVRRKMVAFIRRTLQNWRLHHCVTPSPPPNRYRDVRSYLMSADFLCEGPPPNASGCHACGRIGHWANDCPRRRTRPNKDESRREHHELEVPRNGRLSETRAAATPGPGHSDRATAPNHHQSSITIQGGGAQQNQQTAAMAAAEAAFQVAMAQLRPPVVGTRPAVTSSAVVTSSALVTSQPEDGAARLLSLISGTADTGRRVQGVRRAESLERQMSSESNGTPPPGAAGTVGGMPRPPPGFQPADGCPQQAGVLQHHQANLSQLLSQQANLTQAVLAQQQPTLAQVLSLQQANLTQSVLSHLQAGGSLLGGSPQLMAAQPVLQPQALMALQHPQLQHAQQLQVLQDAAVNRTANPAPPTQPTPSDS